jgi:hypothetical protein
MKNPLGAGNGMVPHYSGTTLDAQARYAAGAKSILENYLTGKPQEPANVIVGVKGYETKACEYNGCQCSRTALTVLSQTASAKLQACCRSVVRLCNIITTPPEIIIVYLYKTSNAYNLKATKANHEWNASRTRQNRHHVSFLTRSDSHCLTNFSSVFAALCHTVPSGLYVLQLSKTSCVSATNWSMDVYWLLSSLCSIVAKSVSVSMRLDAVCFKKCLMVLAYPWGS